MGDLRNRLFSVLGDLTGPQLRAFWAAKHPLVWLLAVAIGVVAAFAILAFRLAIGQIQWLWLGNTNENVVATLAALREPWIIVAAPAVGGLIVGLILWKVMRTRRAHGIADVIEAGALYNAQIALRTGLTSALVSAISIGSGASVGREGPAVHLGATVAAVLDRQFNLTPAARRVLLASGAAAAVSASFNAPIAGVLFAHEIILGHFALSAFVPTVLAAVAATLITRAWLGDFPAFILSEQHIASYWEFPAFALLGLVCGLVAVCFQLSVMVADWSARRVTLPLWLRPALGGLAVGCMALSVPEVLGVGYEATTLALRESYSLGFLFVLLIAKTAATAICLASRFGGGVFSPSLYIGAMAGGAFGIIAAAAFPEYGSNYGVYALIGMGAVAGAVLGAPISTAVIVFELTGGYELTIAILLSVSIASMVMQGLLGKSFFQWQLSQRGVFLGEGSHLRIVRTWTVRDFLTQLTPDELENPPVLEDRPKLVPSDTLETALRTFDEGGYTRLAVFDKREDGVLIGWADQIKALATYNKALIEANVEEHR
ncbi:MAG: chloride channel protein [Anderseniella sp.]|nr:chloride channel protein [Anderseniella sp.]